MIALIFIAWFLLWIVTSWPWPMDQRARQVAFVLVLVVLIILIALGPYDARLDTGTRLRL